jgi:ribosomal protein S18 acetylase RimI-like enzyme
MTISIRKLDNMLSPYYDETIINDLNQIKYINEISLQENYNSWLWKYFFQNGHIYVLEKIVHENKKIIGYILLLNPSSIFKKNNEEIKLLNQLDNPSNILIIGSFAILEKDRGNKYGQMLLQYIITDLKNNIFILNVRKSNSIAYHIYNKIGFIKYDTIKEYYDNPVEDAYIMYLK